MFKPYQLALLKVPTSTRHRVVQIMSYPTPTETIMVRTVPGMPDTLVEVPIYNLLEYKTGDRQRYVHVATVDSIFSFPEDMLRYDNAALYDVNTPEEGENGRGLRGNGVLVYMVSERRAPNWRYGRWESFSSKLTTVNTIDLRK
jgi:hypothetical protein